MRAAMRRMQSGERWWAAEIVFRLVALVSFTMAAICIHYVRLSVVRLPRHEASPFEFAVCAVSVVLLSVGLACLIEGPGMFRLIPYPRRRLF